MTSDQTALQLTGITKTFGKLVANEDISLHLRTGEILALLGENGAGKTTLMNILFGHYVADSGHIEVFGEPLPPGSPNGALKHGVGMVHQHFTLAENMTVLDNITLGTEPLFAIKRGSRAARKKILSLVARFGLEVDPNILVKHLSVGERQRVEILKALYRDSRILILDEPTAVLTPQESENLFITLKLLAGQGLAVIFISHKLKEVISASDRCCVLRHGRVVFESQTSMTSADKLAAAMVGGEIPKTARVVQKFGSEILRLEAVSIRGKDGTAQLDSVNLNLHRGEILGIAGVAGNGQAHLADLVSGMISPDSGKFSVAGEQIKKITPAAMVAKGIGRIPQDRTTIGLIGDMTIQENMVLENYKQHNYSTFGLLRFRNIKKRAFELIERFDIRCPGPSATVRQLSGGNMQKLILARVLGENPKIILACQPTWGLDVGAAIFVHNQLLAAKKQGAAILLVSEDLDELLTIADRIHVIYHGRLTPAISPEETDVAAFGLAMSGHADVVSRRRTAQKLLPKADQVIQ
jgi:general nucleoside transport system ATP-binding protein